MTALGGLPHGYAVGLGMVTAAAGVASRCGMLADADVSAHTDLLAAIGAPVQAPCGIVADDVPRLVRRDNKRGLIPTTAEHHADGAAHGPRATCNDRGHPAGARTGPGAALRP